MSGECNESVNNSCGCGSDGPDLPIALREGEASCCGSFASGNPSSFEPLHFAEGFVETPVGPVPRIKTSLSGYDLFQTFIVRLGVGRNSYAVAPGLYAVGDPVAKSPVLVTANYKLSLDALRRDLGAMDAWILVLDTRGVNVWCAAGKKTFSSQEVIRRVKESKLRDLVSHRRLVLPQLGATGVRAAEVKKACGFTVFWGPVRAEDTVRFIENGMRATKEMRKVKFTLWDRIVLTPVELSQLVKPTIWTLLIVFILSGIGAGIFSFASAWTRGLQMDVAYLAAIFAGAVVAPVLLPWIPGRAFAVKGGITGFVASVLILALSGRPALTAEAVAVVLFTMAISSYLAMNFTGATPYTSPSGVEKEMRFAIPFQALAITVAAIAWVGAAFIG